MARIKWRLFVAWLLDFLDFGHISCALSKRGWVAVPKNYAVRAWPENTRTGWWPALEDEDPNV